MEKCLYWWHTCLQFSDSGFWFKKVPKKQNPKKKKHTHTHTHLWQESAKKNYIVVRKRSPKMWYSFCPSSKGQMGYRKQLSGILYICVYIYMLWSYYLGQVWGFPKLLSGPSQCYYLGQVCFRTIKIGVSGDFFLLSYHFVFFFVSSYLLIF